MVRGSHRGTEAGLAPLTTRTLSPADCDLRQSAERMGRAAPGVSSLRLEAHEEAGPRGALAGCCVTRVPTGLPWGWGQAGRAARGPSSELSGRIIPTSAQEQWPHL